MSEDFIDDFGASAATPAPPPRKLTVKERLQMQFKDGRSRMVIIVAGGIILSTGVYAFSQMTSRPHGAPSSVQAVPEGIDTTVGGARAAASPDYRESVRNDDARSASAVLNSARPGSAVATPGVNERVAPPPPPPPEEEHKKDGAAGAGAGQSSEVKRVDPNPGYPPGYAEKVTARKELIKAQMAAMADSWRLDPHSQMLTANLSGGKATDPNEVRQAQTGNNGMTAYGTPVSATATNAIIQAPGDVEYGYMVTSLNSDVSGPIKARLVSGPLAPADLLGAFEQKDDYVLPHFTKLTRTNKQTKEVEVYDVDIFAVDPATGRVAIAEDVDHHYIERIGLKLAAAFITGYGQAISQGGKTVTTSALGSTTESFPKPSPTEAMMSGAATVGQAVGSELDQHASSRKSTVTVSSGYPVGLMFLTQVTPENKLKANAYGSSGLDQQQQAITAAVAAAMANSGGNGAAMGGYAPQVSPAVPTRNVFGGQGTYGRNVFTPGYATGNGGNGYR